METPCQDCQYIFSDQEMFDLHKENCKNLQGTDPNKKKYLCPLCDRQFRLYKNLKVHSQTIKHIDLLEWHHKQAQESLQTTNSDVKEIIVTNSSLIEKKPKNNLSDLEEAFNLGNSSDFSFEKEIDGMIAQEPDNFLSELEESDRQSTSNDFLAQLMTSRDQIEDKINHFESSSVNSSHFELEEFSNNSNDNSGNYFLDQLMNSREEELNNIRDELDHFQPSQPDPAPQSNNFLDQLMESRQRDLESYQPVSKSIPNNNTNNLNFHLETSYSEPEENDDLFQELQKTRMELDADFNHHQAALEAKEEESDNPLLNALSQVRDKDYLIQQRQNQQGIVYGTPESTKVPEYPIQYHQHPVWHQMSKIIKEKDAPRRLVAVLLGSPVSYYPIIYTFVRFSDRLKGKKEKDLRFKLVTSILEVQKHLIRMLQAGQTTWGQKPIKQVLLVMSQWKVADYYRQLKKE